MHPYSRSAVAAIAIGRCCAPCHSQHTRRTQIILGFFSLSSASSPPISLRDPTIGLRCCSAGRQQPRGAGKRRAECSGVIPESVAVESVLARLAALQTRSCRSVSQSLIPPPRVAVRLQIVRPPHSSSGLCPLCTRLVFALCPVRCSSPLLAALLSPLRRLSASAVHPAELRTQQRRRNRSDTALTGGGCICMCRRLRRDWFVAAGTMRGEQRAEESRRLSDAFVSYSAR